MNSRELWGRLRGVWAVSISLRLDCRLWDRRIHEGTGMHKGGLKRATQESSENRGAEAAREALRREGAILRDSGRFGQNRRVGTPKPRRFRNPFRRPNRHQSERESPTLNAPNAIHTSPQLTGTRKPCTPRVLNSIGCCRPRPTLYEVCCPHAVLRLDICGFLPRHITSPRHEWQNASCQVSQKVFACSTVSSSAL